MLFHTWPFLVFFLVVFGVYLLLQRTKIAWVWWLLISSYFFYGWWNPLFLLLLAYSTALDFWVVGRMEKASEKEKLRESSNAAGVPRKSRARFFWLWVSLINNLILLGFFKYANFVTENLNAILKACGVSELIPDPNILLPVGISFFTFQSMSYTIDFYMGRIEREKSLVRFAAFVALFPQLVAGPIERASALLPQLHRFPKIKFDDVSSGASLFVVGLFKKIAIADYLGMYVSPIYDRPEIQSGLTLVLGTIAFAWQIYFDFSGYSDMARGVARAFGIRLMVNFHHPYLAKSISDFWSRWHISLSTWFRDYVYIPLGGNRCGKARVAINVLVTFLVSGLWHGAAWKFVIWGGIHAVGSLLTRPFEQSQNNSRVLAIFKQVIVFGFVCFAWIFFRANNLDDAWIVIQRIFRFSFSDPKMPVLMTGLVIAVWAYQVACETSRARKLIEHQAIQIAIMLFMLVYLAMIPVTESEPFIYFAF